MAYALEATAPAKIYIGVSDMKVSNDPALQLVTHSLGSCIGVSLHDPVAGVAGLLHYQLPTARKNPEKAAVNPYMFGDTGIAAMFERCFDLGASMENIVVKVAGGASIMDDTGTFNIGKRNYVVLKKLLWKNAIRIAAEDVGGNSWRNMTVSVATGQVWIKNINGTFEL